MKNAEQVLEKHPEHPETLAMRALILNAQKKKTEAFGFIQKALFKNLSNFTCWHVYGILHRGNKNYDDARKAYLNALKYDPNNQNVLRDLGQLQIQLRDYEGYAETRRQVLISKPGMQINWITYAVALYLNQNYKKALEVLTSFEKTLTENKDKLKNHERSELTVFEARIYEAMGDHKKAVEVLSKKQVFDQITKFERLAQNYIKLGDKDKAIESLEELLQLNSSNYNYYFQILEAHGFKKGSTFTDEEQQKIREILEFYESKLPKATAHKRIGLKVFTGEIFKQKLNQYARPLIVKGVPPLIKDLKEIYRSTEKAAIVEEMLLQNIKSMEEKSTLFDDEEEQDPTVYLWLLYFTGQHYYFLRKYDQALNYINKAIEHTPTVIELYIMKAKIFKRAGDQLYASKLYEEARKLDLADRYLNAVSSRYRIRVDQLQEAEDTMALFSKEGQDLNVHDMQCMWYEVECGNSYLRQGNYRMALKNFNYVEKHLEQIFEDQFDFHLYAIRKYTLNSYLQMLDMEDNIYRNKNAVNAAIGMIKTMNKVNNIKEEETKKIEPEMEEYKNSKEYKDLIEDIRKRDEDDDYRNDADPKGYDLYHKALKDPLQKAYEFAVLVAKMNPQSKELQAKVIPLFLKKIENHPTYQKTLPMKLRFLKHWQSLSPEDLKKAIPDERLLKVATQEVESLGSAQDLSAMAEEYLKNNSTSLEHVSEYIKLRMSLFGEKSGEKYEALALKALDDDQSKQDKVYKVANLIRRVQKAGGSGDLLKQKAKQNFYMAKKRQPYDYKQAQQNDYDYEKDILLDEDADDYHAFDYEDPVLPSPTKSLQSTNNQSIKRKDLRKQESEREPLREQKSDYETINLVVDEIQNNLKNNTEESNEDTNDNQFNGEMTEEDHNALIDELDNMIKYDEDDDEEVGILDGGV